LSSAAAGGTELQGVLADLWPLLCHSLQNEHYTRDQVLAATRAALPLMQRVLPVFNAPVVSTSSDEEALPNDRRLRQVHRALKELSEGQETWQTRVQLQVIQDEVAKVRGPGTVMDHAPRAAVSA
jgi:hypothetical protein